jgi:hypothetical protein
MADADADGNMVEIREFMDATGTEVSSEVVKLSDEAKAMKNGEVSKVDEVMERLQENLKMGPAQGVEMDDQARLVRELAMLSHQAQINASATGADRGGDLDFLDDLEQKEEEAEKSDSTHVFAAASSGWKKGFLGGGGKPKTKKAPAAAAAASVQSGADTTPKPVPSQKTVSFGPDTTVAADATSNNSPSSSSSSSATASEPAVTRTAMTAGTSAEVAVSTNSSSNTKESSTSEAPRVAVAPRPTAFSGVIKERF